MSEENKVYGTKDYGDLFRSLADVWPAKYQKPIRLLVEDIIKMFPHEIDENGNGLILWEIESDIYFYTQSEDCAEYISGKFILKNLKSEIYLFDLLYGDSEDIEHLDNLEDIYDRYLHIKYQFFILL